MNIIHKVEDLILDILLSKNLNKLIKEELLFEKINCFKNINNCFPDNDVDSLLNLIPNENIIEKVVFDINKKYQQLYLNCVNLMEDKNYIRLAKIFVILDKINIHPLYYYFFSKIQIKFKLEIFNIVPLSESIIYDYPMRVYIDNIYDLEKDIGNMIYFISTMCCQNKKIIFENITNDAINYHYFFQLVIYNIKITKKTRQKYNYIINDLMLLEKKISFSINNNIPLKIKTGFKLN